MAQERLKRSELEILLKEEEALKEIIAKYEDGLNKLKVEELTIRSELGRAQDKDLHSRNNTPISDGNTSRPDSANTGSPITLTSQSLKMFRSLGDSDNLEISVAPSTTANAISNSVNGTTTNATLNQSTLNLGTALIDRYLQDRASYEDEEEEEADAEAETEAEVEAMVGEDIDVDNATNHDTEHQSSTSGPEE